MKVQFADSFVKSLKRLMWHESRIYKSYSLFRYDIPHFFANIWRFRKVLWNHQWWDYRYTLEALYTSLSLMEKGMHGGMEVRQSRDKKIAKMQRALELLKNKMNDTYFDRAQEVLGKLPDRDWKFEDIGNGCSRLIDNDTPEEKEQWKSVYDYARNLEETEWEELWQIFKGQTNLDYKEWEEKNKGEFTQEEIDNANGYYKFFDGSGLNGWWD